jgi:hypothetical protein
MMFNYGFVLVSGYSTLFLFVQWQRLQRIWLLYGTCCAKRETDPVNHCKRFVYTSLTQSRPPSSRLLLAPLGQKTTPTQAPHRQSADSGTTVHANSRNPRSLADPHLAHTMINGNKSKAITKFRLAVLLAA